MFNDDQDEVQFFYDDSVPLGDAPQDWKLPSVSAIVNLFPYQLPHAVYMFSFLGSKMKEVHVKIKS